MKPAATFDQVPTQHPACQPALEIVVIFTALKQTLEALRTAASLAQGLHAAIRVIVPQIVPLPFPLDRPPVGREFTERRFQTLIPSGPIPTWVDVRLCRDESAIVNVLASKSLVVIGVRTRWWPRSDRSLARWLRAAGHHVVIAERKRGRHA
jgi:hypothetical protein